MCVEGYSDALWGQLATQAIRDHTPSDPLYLHLCFQAVHRPYDGPPQGFPPPPGNVTWPGSTGAGVGPRTAPPSCGAGAGAGWHHDRAYDCRPRVRSPWKLKLAATNATIAQSLPVHVPRFTAAECCSACRRRGTCVHWTFTPARAGANGLERPGDAMPDAAAAAGGQGPCALFSTPAQLSASKAWWGCSLVVAKGAVSGDSHGEAKVGGEQADVGAKPGAGTDAVYAQMLWASDYHIGGVVAALKEQRMWESTLLVYASDNGGTLGGNNYPLRGIKSTNWEGGMRAAAFVAGGLVPKRLRGTANALTMHVADWYPTLATLAGADPADDPPAEPLPVSLADPARDIYGNASFPPVDGIDLWPYLMDPAAHVGNHAAIHASLVLSKEVIIVGAHKLIVAQNHGEVPFSDWRQADGSWVLATPATTPPCAHMAPPPSKTSLLAGLPPGAGAGARPCLFNIRADPSEKHDLGNAAPHPTGSAARPAAAANLVAELWRALNLTVLTSRDCSVTGLGGCSPAAMLGPCNERCAEAHWLAKYGDPIGPVCGVPGCADSGAAKRKTPRNWLYPQP